MIKSEDLSASETSIVVRLTDIESLYRELSEIRATQWKMTSILVGFMILQTSWFLIGIS